MTTDLILAAAHHLLMFAIAALLVTELVLVFRGLNGATIVILSRLDAWFGVSAGSLLVIGFLRVFLGAKAEAYYFENPVFWVKIGAFAIVGFLSIVPTIRFIRWAQPARADRSFQPPPEELRTVKRFILLEGGIFLLIPVLAAAMARGYGLA
jgi:putative membrane protein